MECRSEHRILEEILTKFGQVIPDNKSTHSLMKRFPKKVGSDWVTCLDEIDQLKDKKILQFLCSQQSKLILITNNSYFTDGIGERIQSRLFLAEVEFPGYRKSELVDILKDRITSEHWVYTSNHWHSV